MMATAVQKNGMKSLSNSNGLIVHNVDDLSNLSSYSLVNECNGEYTTTNVVSEQHLQGYSQVNNVEQSCNQGETNLSSNSLVNKEYLTTYVQDNSQVNNVEHSVEVPDEEAVAEEPEIDITISNVVCSFSVRCHLNLREIAKGGINVEHRREFSMITMKIRRPYSTASMWSSGKVTCTGTTSEDEARVAARRFARLLQKLGYNVKFNNYRVVNVLGSCTMPFAIRIAPFCERHRDAEYEPELHPGVTYRIKNPKASLKIFSNGKVTVTAPCVANVQSAIEYIYPLIYEFRRERTEDDLARHASKKKRVTHNVVPVQSNSGVITTMEEDDEDSESEW